MAQPTPALDRLAHEIGHAAHFLPEQGPIGVFIHQNTLHAFSARPFEEAVVAGSATFGCEPFLSEERFRDELERGRIRHADLRAALDAEESGENDVAGLCTRGELRLAMLEHPLQSGSPSEIRWFLEETDALRRVRRGVSPELRGRLVAEARHWVMRDLRGGSGWTGPAWLPGLLDRFGEGSIEEWEGAEWEAFALRLLWNVCLERCASLPAPQPPPLPVRHRDLVRLAGGPDSDERLLEPLVRFCGAFLDQGVAAWPLPGRERGLFAAFSALHRQPMQIREGWMAGLPAELARIEKAGLSPLGVVMESLADLGVREEEWGPFLRETLLALPGWAGMIWQVEERSERVPLPPPKGSLEGFLAVRLLLERFALRDAAREMGHAGPLAGLREEARRRLPTREFGPEPRAFVVFQLAQALGWPPDRLHRLGSDAWAALVREVEAFGDIERRRVFHLAYERRFRIASLDAVALRAALPDPTPPAPRFQAVFCIDEREESVRRHLEEVAPDCETFGAAGFYGVAMRYRGATDAHFVPKCPAPVTPRHWVEEEPEGDRAEAERLSLQRKALG
ncbi:MAG: DUF2309 domain-containing protein, partial [Gemmataceae bacterium]|nr:DUF2309 domain-containing protein [Gemmataceae bacterium]